MVNEAGGKPSPEESLVSRRLSEESTLGIHRGLIAEPHRHQEPEMLVWNGTVCARKLHNVAQTLTHWEHQDYLQCNIQCKCYVTSCWHSKFKFCFLELSGIRPPPRHPHTQNYGTVVGWSLVHWLRNHGTHRHWGVAVLRQEYMTGYSQEVLQRADWTVKGQSPSKRGRQEAGPFPLNHKLLRNMFLSCLIQSYVQDPVFLH